MPRSYLDPPIPIVALATAPGVSALAVLRASGAGCVELLSGCFSRGERLVSAPGHSLVPGNLIDPVTTERIDEVLVAVFRAPSSPTGEDQIEVTCHGSPVIVRRILDVLQGAGFARALPGEFTFRAFANGKQDLVGAEAVDELVSAPGEAARAEAMGRLGGGLSKRLGKARTTMLELLAEAEVRLDYAEEDGSPSGLFPGDVLLEFRDELAALAASWMVGKLHAEGVRVVIAGSANAGKSSLFNLLVREERAIVSPEPGTTRDWIESGFEIAGIPVRLVDTAGLREGTGDVEAAGMERSRALAVAADVVICLADATKGLGPGDEELLGRRLDALKAWNKVDLVEALPRPPGWIALSAIEGTGLPELLAALEGELHRLETGLRDRAGKDETEEFVVTSPRQKRLLDRAVDSLDGALALVGARGADESVALDAAALELRDAADAIGELTGEIATPEVLEAIFSGFCLGK